MARICVCGTKLCILHLKSSHLRSLNTKKGVVSSPLGSKDYIGEGEFQTLKGQVSLILSFQNSNRKIRAGERLLPSEKLVPKLRWQSNLPDRVHCAYWHHYPQSIRETSLSQHCCKTIFRGSQLLGSTNHLSSRAEVSCMAKLSIILGREQEKVGKQKQKGN